MPKGRLVGIDLGLKRVGVSISDDLGMFAHPLDTIGYRNQLQVLREVIDLADRHNAVGFVVGIPKNMDGTLGESARRSVRFARKLQARSSLPVVLWDERLTTSQAEREMIGLGMSRRRRRLSIDEAASVLILENYLRCATNARRRTKGSENVNNRDDRKPKDVDEEDIVDDDVIVLADEDGKEVSFRILIDDLFVDDRQYVVLMPVDDEANLEPELVILRVEELGEDDAILATIDDEDEWEEVLAALEEIEDSFGEYEIEVEDYDTEL